MAVRAAVPTFSDRLVTTGKGGAQTIIGGTQAGGDLVIQDNPTNTGGLIRIGGGLLVDRTGPTLRAGMLTPGPLQNSFQIPVDTRILGAGTGTVQVVNDVLAITGADVGGGWTHDPNAGTIAPTNNTDQVTLPTTLRLIAAGAVIDVPLNTTTTGTDSGKRLPVSVAGATYYLALLNAAGSGGGGGGSITPADTFVRGNYPGDLSGSTSSGGQTWTAVRSTWLDDADGAGGGWAKLNSLGNVMAMATLSGQNSSGDGTVQVTLTTDLSSLPGANTDCGLVLRLENNSSSGRAWLLLARVANNQYVLQDWTGTAFGTQTYTAAVTPAKGDVIQVILAGTTITVNVNGTQRINQTVTQAWTSVGNHGICCAANTGNANIRWKAYSGPA